MNTVGNVFTYIHWIVVSGCGERDNKGDLNERKKTMQSTKPRKKLSITAGGREDDNKRTARWQLSHVAVTKYKRSYAGKCVALSWRD